MSPASSTSHTSPAPAASEASSLPGGLKLAETPDAPAIPHLPEAARRTVETVMTSADRYASDARAVSLRFSVSGVDLSVHVAMRGDAIHTTFRTDSPELRSALEDQWRAVTSDDRSQRLADPVFTATKPGTGSTSTSGDGSASRDPSARQNPSSAPAFASSFARGSRPAAAAGAMPAAAPVARPTTTRLLHAFA